MRTAVLTLLLGSWMGFALSRIGFSSWDQVHRMFVFDDLRMLLAFMLAVGLLVVAQLSVRRWRPGYLNVTNRPLHNGTLAGGALFGVGWALTGACPSIALVQLGEGQLGALLTLAGIFGGNYLYAVVHERYLRWDLGSCVDE
jgi:uncharacterized membrane protein YedE/YeeE